MYSGELLRGVKNKPIGARGPTRLKLCDFPLRIKPSSGGTKSRKEGFLPGRCWFFGFLDIYFSVANENVLTQRFFPPSLVHTLPPARLLYSSAESGERTREDIVTCSGAVSRADLAVCFSPPELGEADVDLKPVFLFIGVLGLFPPPPPPPLRAVWQHFETLPQFFVFVFLSPKPTSALPFEGAAGATRF